MSSMYFLFTTLRNVQAATLVELLQRLARVFKDYCGVITEESVRRNFLLLYELLDEVFDRGIPQGMSTELLKAYVYNEPVNVAASSGGLSSPGAIVSGMGLGKLVSGVDKVANALGVEKVASALDRVPGMGERKTLSSAAANKPIAVSGGGKRESEVFVDVVERLTLVLNRAGQVTQSQISGSIVLRSFMTGCPELRLGLNDDLSILSLGLRPVRAGPPQPSQCLPLDDCCMHECVRWEEASRSAVFTFFAPDGEFTLLTYRIGASFRPPILVHPFLEAQGARGLDYVLRVRAEFPADKAAANVHLSIPLPSFAASVSLETAAAPGGAGDVGKGPQLSAGKAELDRRTLVAGWLIPRMPGGSEVILRAKILLPPHVEAQSVELADFGPVRVGFELPMHLVSGVHIKFLDLLHGGGKSAPAKWIRNVTQAQSYVARWT